MFVFMLEKRLEDKPMETIYSQFRLQVEKNPTAPAVIDSRRTISYRRLDEMSESLAAILPPAHSGLVGIVTDHSPEMIASILAVLRMGRAYVPVEPSFPTDRINFIMHECDVDFVITNRKYAHKVEAFDNIYIHPRMKLPKPKAHVGDWSKPSGLAYVLYTSGSTGMPKGVMVENRNVVNYARAFAREFRPAKGDVMLQYSVCSFDIFVEEVFTTLLNGACLAIPPKHAREDIGELMQFVQRNKVTIISGFPYLLNDFNKLAQLPPSLRLLISGGDVLRHSYIDNLLPKVEVYNTYGPSETTVCCSYYRCRDGGVQADGTYPIGHPVLGVDIDIRDAHLCPVGPGEKGEICIRGKGVSRGYIGKREVENRMFVTLSDGTRLYRSGDLGMKCDDGNFMFFNRIDNQVMILGKRVETTEVENILNNCEPIDRGVVTSGVDSQGLSYLTAYVVPKSHSHFSIRSLKQLMAKFLPPYMIPEFFVSLETMPLTPNGKVDLRALPKIKKTGKL